MGSGTNPGSPPRSRRERFRDQTRVEIRQAARRQVEQGGAGALSLKALAHELGMAGPSLYRYVASRDELLTEFLVEAYTELAEALEAAAGEAGTAPQDRLRTYCHTYRRWALDRPAAYELLFGTPVPGYAAPGEATVAPARRCMATLLATVVRLRGGSGRADGRARAPQVPLADPDSAALAVAVAIWARVHGVVSLELRGHLGDLVGPADELFAAEIEHAVRLAS